LPNKPAEVAVGSAADGRNGIAVAASAAAMAAAASQRLLRGLVKTHLFE
jgi:hypothetical protein